jgi:hypothetical protein
MRNLQVNERTSGCSWCGVGEGQHCVTWNGTISKRPHGVRQHVRTTMTIRYGLVTR